MGEQLDKAMQLHRSGDWPAAEKIYESLYRRNASDAAVAFYLGAVRLSLGHNEAALQPLQRAVRLAPRNVQALSALAEAFDRLGRIDSAIDAYRRATALAPRDARLQLALGSALLAGDAQAALAAFDAAIAADPSLAPAHNNAGLALKRLGRFDEAADRFAAAVAIAPDYGAAAFNLGNMLSVQGRMNEAEPWLRRAVEMSPALGHARLALANVLRETGRHEAALAELDRVLAHAPDDPVAQVWRCVFELPALYRDQSEIDRSRARYATRLSELAKRVEADPQRFLSGLATTRPFLLAYQGKSDRDLQTVYGGMLEKAVAAHVTAAPLSKWTRGQKVRIGIVSSYFCAHSVWKIPTKGWLQSLDRQAFEVFAYHTSANVDDRTEFARAHTDRFVQGPLDLAQWVELIRQDRCDILLYPEIGMDEMALQLAALRLAPVQVNGLGHPVTSGLSTIDVVLSSALMEPEGAQADYTERLISLPNLGVYYEPLPVPDLAPTREALGLAPDNFVFWCPQSLFKYQPRFDDVYARIASAAPRARFVFITYQTGAAATAIVTERLEQSFAKAGLAMQDHCIFLPRLSQAEFIAAAGLCDAMLDSIEWSGFNSSLESLTHTLPIVSFDGTFMRGRHSAAILRRLDVEALIAGDIDTYVAIAQRLATDPAWRRTLSDRIETAKPLLFNDDVYRKAFNDTLLGLIS